MGNRVAENILATIESLDNLILASPSFRFNLITKDYDENKFVDCAIAANADFILTEDNHFQELKQIDFPKVNIIGIKDFQSLFS